jgi:adenylate cyclase
VARLLESTRELNRNAKLVAAARRMRERALGDDEFHDRLSTARGRPSDVAVRELAALRSATPGVVGELGMTALQAWQRLSETQGRGRGEVDVAVMFTDIAGFSSWALEAGDELALALLRDVSEAIEPPVTVRRGEVVKRLGDGLMAVFWDAPSAAAAAFEARERAEEIDVDGYVPRLRTGVHLGRPRRLGGDYFGVDVNIAARLVEAAAPGEILVSDPMLAALDAASVTASKRRFRAKGAPSDLAVHAVQPVP